MGAYRYSVFEKEKASRPGKLCKAMRPETILKVCDALHISTEYLLRGVITEADSSLLMKKISTLTPKQYRHFEDILDSFIAAIQEEA